MGWRIFRLEKQWETLTLFERTRLFDDEFDCSNYLIAVAGNPIRYHIFPLRGPRSSASGDEGATRFLRARLLQQNNVGSDH
jgi:hypothetical protein